MRSKLEKLLRHSVYEYEVVVNVQPGGRAAATLYRDSSEIVAAYGDTAAEAFSALEAHLETLDAP